MSTQSNQSRSKGSVKGKVSLQELAPAKEIVEGQEQLDTEGSEKLPLPEHENLELAPAQQPAPSKPQPDLAELATRMVRMEQAVKGLRREVTTSAELLDQSMELKCKDVLDHVSYQGRRIGHIERELNIVPSTTTTLANEEEHIMENVIAGQEQVVAGQEATAEQKEGMLKRLASSTTSKVVLGVVGAGAVAAVGYYAYTKLSHKDEAAMTDTSTDPMAAPAMSYDSAPEATRY